MNSKSLFISIVLLSFFCSFTFAQDKIYKGELYNKENDIIIKINVYDTNISIPGQEIFGELAGYLKSSNDSRCWLFTSAKINETNPNKLYLEIINDYGSEDLTATLSFNEKDSIYTLTQEKGSLLKIARKGKWVKLPKTISFLKK